MSAIAMDRPLVKNSPPGRVPKDFIVLSRQLLQLANQGATRLEFLRAASRLLLTFTRCDDLEVWLSDGPLHYRWTCASDDSSTFQVSGELERFRPFLDTLDEPIRGILEAVLDGRIHEQDPERTANIPSEMTYDGTWWTPKTSAISNNEKRRSGMKSSLPGYGSLALIRINVDDHTHGVLILSANTANFFTPQTIENYEAIAQTLGMAIAGRRAQAALKERVKEFTCLYGIAHILEHRDLSLADSFRQIVQLLPPAWQFPEMAAARIELDGKVYEAGATDKLIHRQCADILVDGKRRGRVEVGYNCDREDFAEGAFLHEEQSLLEVIAREISHFVERHEAGEQRVRLETQLLHADRLATIGQFAAGIAHEINEPLGGILGFAQLARKNAGVPQQTVADLDQIVAAALRAREIVRKLMLFSRQTPPAKSMIQLNQVVEEAVAFLRARWTERKLELVRDLDPDLPELLADPVQIHQVAVNLLVNAIQAIPDTGRITVRTRADGSAVKLIVEDTGVGIHPDLLPKIFNPFFTTKDVGIGTGLGLSVVHGIVSSHGGCIDVFSQPGHGARFDVTLPLDGPDPRQESAS